MIQFIDMFAGIGGFREGLTLAGDFVCVGHCEIDKHADRSYRALFDTEGEWFIEDARKADPSTMPDFQLLCGGFPCQTFSIAGSRKGFGDPRGTLFFELARLAEARHPAYLLFENVPGLLSHDGGRTFATILDTLDRLGYGVEWQCLNSKDFGVPQSRNRLYIIGYLDARCRGKVFPFTEAAGTALMQIKFYSSLTADFFPNDPTDLGSSYKESEGIPYTGEELTGYRGIIRKAVQDDIRSFNGDLMQYYHEDDSLRSKVVRAVPGVDEVNGELVGSLCVDTNVELTTEEQAKLCDYISGQYSDGWGEGFEQREVDVGDGSLCVHFWQPTGFELKRDVPEPEKAPSRPKMQLAGQDGNIFAIIGRASRLLSDSGQADKAKEMRSRVMDCLSYEASLKVVSEYVETEISEKPKMPNTKRDRSEAR